ncbi:MAG TPA: class IIb bacteriocin, lactobin A/cerein 7B family [Longimicrobium sp.]|nr:class IIb bacteriocin, lactobin A/cerein 7B family [Longimicrobium sp.]
MSTETRTIEETQQKLNALLARSATDAGFRARLLSSPDEAMAEFSGKPVRHDLKIVFIENDADATFVLPAPIVGASELSEAELEAVAGGIVPLLCAGIAAGGLIGAVLHEAGYL